MQLKASKTKRRIYKRTVADEVCRAFIAQTTVTDPNMIQPGQVLVDQSGQEMQVVENQPTTDNVVIAPADQDVPEGTTSVPNMDLTNYSVKTDENAPQNGVTNAQPA